MEAYEKRTAELIAALEKETTGVSGSRDESQVAEAADFVKKIDAMRGDPAADQQELAAAIDHVAKWATYDPQDAGPILERAKTDPVLAGRIEWYDAAGNAEAAGRAGEPIPERAMSDKALLKHYESGLGEYAADGYHPVLNPDPFYDTAEGRAEQDKIALRETQLSAAREKASAPSTFDRKAAYEAVRGEVAKPVSLDERKALWGKIKGGTAERPDDEAAKRAERAEQQRTARPVRGPSWER